MTERFSPEPTPDEIAPDQALDQQPIPHSEVASQPESDIEHRREVLASIHQTIMKAALQARYGRPDERQAALNLMKNLLEARENYLLDLVRAVNPDVEPVDGRPDLYRTGEVYGSLWAMRDVTPEVQHHAFLAQELSLGHVRQDSTDDPSSSLTGEDLPPRALVDASTVRMEGSGAQSRIQEFATDLDLSEHLQIRCQTPEQGLALVAQKMQELTTKRRTIADANGQSYEIVPQRVWLRQKNQHEENQDGQEWLPSNVERGSKKYYDAQDQLRQIMLSDSIGQSDKIILEFIVSTGQDTFEVSQRLSIELQTDQQVYQLGTAPLAGRSFQEVYFQPPPASEGSTRDPQQLLGYMGNMADQLAWIERRGKPDSVKTMKRLYNFSKATGDFEAVADLEELFHHPICHVHQLTKRLPAAFAIWEQTRNYQPLASVLEQLRSSITDAGLDIPPEIDALLDQRLNKTALDHLMELMATHIIEPTVQQQLTTTPELPQKLAQARQFSRLR